MATHCAASDQLDYLWAEVRNLGRMLGRTIAALRGEGTLATVENLRTLATAASLLTPSEALDQAMAFALYFELVNLAEENLRI